MMSARRLKSGSVQLSELVERESSMLAGYESPAPSPSRLGSETVRRKRASALIAAYNTVYAVQNAIFQGSDHRETGVIEEAHTTEVFCAVYVGDYMVSCALDGSIALWDAHTHRRIATRERGSDGAHTDGVFQLAGCTSANHEGCVLSIDWGGVVKVWSVPDLDLCSTTDAHPKVLDPSARYGGFSIAATPSGDYVATGGGDGCRRLKLWRLDADDFTLSLIEQVEVAHAVVYHLDFAPQGDVLASIGSDHTIKLWSVPELAPVCEKADGNGGSNKHALFSPSGESLATCGSDLHIKLWAVPDLELQASRDNAHSSEVRRIAFTPDGSTLASCSLDASIRLWSASALSPIGVLPNAHAGKIFHLVFAPYDGGRTLTSCGADHEIKVWATPTLAMSAGSKSGAFAKGVVGVGFLGDAQTVLAVSSDLAIKMWHLPAFAEIGREGESERLRSLQAESRKATLSPDGTLLAAMHGREGHVRMWALGALPHPTVTRLFDQRLHHVPSYAVCFTHDSKGLITGSEDGSICSWTLRPDSTGCESLDVEWKAHGGDYIANLACHPDGDLLASMSVLSSLKLWRLNEGKIGQQLFELRRSHVHDANAHLHGGLAFAPSGSMLASSGDVLKIWAVKTHSLEEVSQMQLSTRSSVAFSPDSKTIALARDDGAIACYFAQHLPESDLGLFERGLEAVVSGDMAALRALPEGVLGARDVRRATFGWTLLHHACKLLDMEAVEALIEAQPATLIDALAPPFDSVMRGKNHTLRIRSTPTTRPAWAHVRAPDLPIVPSVLEVALRADAKGCIGVILEALTRLVHHDPNNATSFTRTRAGERFMQQLVAIGERYPALLSALLPALGFAHQPSGKCTANVVGSKMMYVCFSNEATPYALARSLGQPGTREGVKRFWATAAPRPRPHLRFGEDERAQANWGKVRRAVKLYRKPSGTNYTSCVVPFCGDFVDFLVCLERLNGRSTRAGLYDNAITLAIVKAFWRNGAGRIHVALFAAYGALLTVVVAYSVVPDLISSSLLIVFAAPFILMEVFTFVTSESAAVYFLSAANWADLINYVLIFVVGFPNLVVVEDTRRCLLATLVVLMGFKVLFYMRAYTTLVRTVLQAISDIRAFVLIVLLILVSFAIAFDVLTTTRVSENSVLTLFGLMLGNFETESYAIGSPATDTSIVLQVAFYLFALLVAIVLLNLLIAILGDSYDVVTEKKKAEYVRMRAQLVIEYVRLFPFLIRQQGKWLHVLVRTALTNEQRIFELEEESTIDDEWSSRLTMLKNSVAAMRKDQDDTRLRTEWKLDLLKTDVHSRVDGIRLELSAKLDSVLEQLGRLKPLAKDEPQSARRRKRNTEATMAMPPTPGAMSLGNPYSWSLATLPGILH